MKPEHFHEQSDDEGTVARDIAMTNTEAIFDRLLREALLPRDLPKAQSHAQCQQVIERRIEMLGGDPLDFDEFRLQQAAAVMWNKLLY